MKDDASTEFEAKMRRIIRGAVYDTETATEIAYGDHGHDESQAWWRLYRNSAGAFFEVVAGHDGVVEEVNPLTRARALAFLETNAIHLVEEVFGPMPDVRPSRFSRQSVIAAIGMLERSFTHAAFTRSLLGLGTELARRCDGGSITDRGNHLIKVYDADHGQRIEDGRPLADALVEQAVTFLPPPREPLPWDEPTESPPHVSDFTRALGRDGFVVSNGALRRSLPSTVRVPEAADQVVDLLAVHAFAVAQGHLDQAFDNHAKGNWAAANSQIRAFLEGLLDEMAVRLDPGVKGSSGGQGRRAKLAAMGFLMKGLNEWGDNGFGFVNGLMTRLHPQGAHPGLSDEDDSTFRLHIVLLTARLLLVRFDGWPKS